MSLIVKPSQLKVENIILKGLIYGQPGIGKTTIALSSPNPLLIDFDNGLRRVDTQYQKDSVQVKSYKDLIDVLNSEDIKNYDTIVIDTLGKMIDRMGDYIALTNPKLKQADGQLAMKGWGAIKLEFQQLLKLFDNKRKSVIFIAHEKEDKENDRVIKRPDVAGSSGKDVVKELDFMGYMSMVGNKRTIDLMPNEAFYAKNSLGIEGFLEFPILKGVNDFLKKNIFEKYQEKQNDNASLREKFNMLISLIDDKISALNNENDVNLYYANEFQKMQPIWSSAEYEKHKLSEKIKGLGLIFNKETKTFEKNV